MCNTTPWCSFVVVLSQLSDRGYWGNSLEDDGDRWEHPWSHWCHSCVLYWGAGPRTSKGVHLKVHTGCCHMLLWILSKNVVLFQRSMWLLAIVIRQGKKKKKERMNQSNDLEALQKKEEWSETGVLIIVTYTNEWVNLVSPVSYISLFPHVFKWHADLQRNRIRLDL